MNKKNLILLLIVIVLIGCTQSIKEQKKEAIMEKADQILPEQQKFKLKEKINRENITIEELEELDQAMQEFMDAYETVSGSIK